MINEEQSFLLGFQDNFNIERKLLKVSKCEFGSCNKQHLQEEEFMIRITLFLELLSSSLKNCT